jgi:hypothetical protein
MPWTYSQSTGALRLNGVYKFTGYAGFGEGKNNPKMEKVPNVGPLPKGRYIIKKPINKQSTGEYSIPLEPASSTKLFGRFGFYIHGDSEKHPGSASTGCIILKRIFRKEIIKSHDYILEVIE